MRNSVLQVGCLLVLVSFCSTPATADFVIDTFDDQPTGFGPNQPVNYFSFGDQFAERGVSDTMGAVSGTQSAYYVIDFSVIGFGVGAAREGLALQLDGQQSIRVAARTTVDLGSTGFVAFRLKDQDGTVVRTADADLFSIGTSFTTISQTINNLTVVDESGSTPGLNLQQIQSVGLIFFDRGFSATSTMVFDNLAITSVPEPSSIVLAIAATSIGLAARWRKRNAQT